MLLAYVQQHVEDHVSAHALGGAAAPSATEHIVDGGFPLPNTAWTTSANWSIPVGGYAQCLASGSTLAGQLYQAFAPAILAGVECTLTFDVTDNNSDSAGLIIRAVYDGVLAQVIYNDGGVAPPGTNTVVFTTAAAIDGIAFRGYTGAFAIQITNVSLMA